MTPSKKAEHVYLVYHVVRAEHEVGHEDERLSEKPVKIFGTLKEADNYASDCRREGRGMPDVNPFYVFAPRHAMYSDLTSYPYPVFHDWLLEAEIEPPRDANQTPPISEWAEWYAHHYHRWTKKQLACVWKALDQIDPFVIMELEVED